MLKNRTILEVIISLLENRKIYVEINDIKSRQQGQKNSPTQDLVLALLLFNIYTSYQYTPLNVHRFTYADDICVTTQASTFQEVETRLTAALEPMGQYFAGWSLKPNLLKTKVCVFHQKNMEANCKLKIIWCDSELEYHQFPVSLGITLIRTLSFATHM